LVERRLNFWGYGSLEAPVWFVGMEEGLGDTGEEELEIRFRATAGKAMVDMRRDMSDVPNHMRWLQPPYPIQNNWKYPIALYLYFKNDVPPTQEDVRRYQAHTLGDIDLKDTAVTNLCHFPHEASMNGNISRKLERAKRISININQTVFVSSTIWS
jgi:hypothetical protein